jgi:hypothetical protein
LGKSSEAMYSRIVERLKIYSYQIVIYRTPSKLSKGVIIIVTRNGNGLQNLLHSCIRWLKVFSNRSLRPFHVFRLFLLLFGALSSIFIVLGSVGWAWAALVLPFEDMAKPPVFSHDCLARWMIDIEYLGRSIDGESIFRDHLNQSFSHLNYREDSTS